MSAYVYIVLDDCPPDFGLMSILAVYSTKKRADKFIANRKKRNPYLYQYIVSIRRKVRK